MVNEPTFSLDMKNGGLNWGFCKKPDKNANDKYTAIVYTSSKENSETTSTIKVKMYGQLGKSDYFTLSSGFERGSQKKIEYDGPDLGGLQKIRLKIEGTQPYRCKKITIFKGYKSFNFECLQNLIPCNSDDPDNSQCKLESEVDGSLPYEVSVRTSDDKDSGTNSPILIKLLGKKGESQSKLLSDTGFKVGSSKTKKISINDIGEITGFKLNLSENGQWKPNMIIIKNILTMKRKKFEIPNTLIINPGKNDFLLNTNSNKIQTAKQVSRTLDIDNPDGGLMNYEDYSKIIKLKCDQTLINPSPSKILFGPDYPTRNVNYMNILASCPSNCHLKNEKVFGLAIHPDVSPICLSALVDNAISYYGGIISISILPGLDQYNVPKETGKKNGINVFSYNSSSKKSFSVSKVDNVDLVEKDIRILDNLGRLSNEGRLEMRREGEWGSICAFGNNKLSAKRICKDLGFRDGEWKSPSDQRAKNFCRSFKSRNHCGARHQIVHFSNLKCSEIDNNFSRCNKDISDPKTCTHDFDAIIRCFNENYNIETEIPDGIVRLELSQKKGIAVFGRLEMYTKGKYLPICNIGFNSGAAKIACKQMGFENGELITNASVIKDFQLDNENETLFAAEKVNCRGTENKIKECNLNSINIKCKHEMDTVLKCIKGNGDISGKTQYQKRVNNPPPSLGKLGIIKIKLSCNDKGQHELLRGDPGSVFIVECPASCGKSDGTIWGTGIYTSNSNICKAAIHTGVIQNNLGGEFILSRTFGQNFYSGTKNNGIISTIYLGRWPVSITFFSINSGYDNINKIAFNSFIEKPSEVKLVSKFKSELDYFSSFLETDQNLNLPTPIFEWMPVDYTFKFSDLNNVLIKEHKLSVIKKFSLLIKFRMTDFKETPSYLFSYSGCNGLNVMIDETDNIIIGDLCNSKKSVKPGYMVPLQDKILLFISYNNGKLYLRIYSSQSKTLFEKTFTDKSLEFDNPGPIGIGRMGIENKNFFYGSIEFLQIYDSEIPIELINSITKSLRMPIKKGIIAEEKTIDDRLCVSICTSNPTPGNKGSGKTPPEANLYGQNKGNESLTKIKKSKASDLGTYYNSQTSNLESIDINCQINLNDNRFIGSVGMIYRVNCKTCYGAKGVVFGTAIYHPLSSICKAAYHSGTLKKGKAGTILLEITNSQPVFNGSQGQDGSNSATFSGAERSFRLRKSPKLTKISCMTKGNDIIFSKKPFYTRFVVQCPKNCLRFKGQIYGTTIYSENSSICKAAIHYGIIGSKGGEVQFIIENGLQNYKSSKGFGIISKSKSSQVRSFKFVGNRSAIGFTYKEDFNGSLNKRWEVNIHSDAINHLSNIWNFIQKDNFIYDQRNTKLKALIHSGTVSVAQSNEYGSVISLKNSEWANSIIKFNFMLYDTNPISSLIRFKDMHNYYAIQFSVLGGKNIKLIQKIDGLSKVILSKPCKILMKKWYRVTIELYYDNVKLKLQSHNIREHKIIFNSEITGISRGTLGFGTRGNNKFYISGIDISELKPNLKIKLKSNKRSWTSILRKVKRRDRLMYCKTLYNSISSEIKRCVEINNYCQIRCDEKIPRVENILNFSCARDCVRTSQINQGKSELSKLISKQKWIPKINEKCDFLPEGEIQYRVGIVKKILNKNNRQILTVKYLEDAFNSEKAELEFPSPRLVKCGEKLKARSDCKFKKIKN